MNKSYLSAFNYDINDSSQNIFNDEEYSLNSYKDSLNYKEMEKNFNMDYIETGISNNKKEVSNDINKGLDVNNSNQNLLGKKKKDSSKEKRHNKYSADNIFKKIKSTLLTYLFIFINSVINQKYNGNIGKGENQKQLKKINKAKIVSSTFDTLLLTITLKGIFSEAFYENKVNEENHNSILIEQLLNEEDEGKRIFFNKLFNLTFIDVLSHFGGKKKIDQLQGLYSLDTFLNKFKDDRDYKDNIKYYINNFESIVKKKKEKKEKIA